MKAVLTARARPLVTIQSSLTAIDMEARIIGRELGGRRRRIHDEYWTFTTDATGDRTNQNFRSDAAVPFDMEVLSAQVSHTGGGAVKRGQLFLHLHTENRGPSLCFGYTHEGHPVPLGLFESSISGRGFKENRELANDVVPADIEVTLATNNALRRIDGFVWYWHCSSDVASRVARVSLRDMGNGLPTGMTSGANTSVKLWPSAAALTLTANEEGMIYVNAAEGKSFAASLDNGTLTIEDITTQPDPFPYWAQESDVAELFFDVSVAQPADRHSVYLFQEEWIER